MEEAANKHWLWMRRKKVINNVNDEKPYVRSIIGDSWEEQAFAEDTAGPLGGFMWPPRFYSCSFCAREFKSAQALGGHMNVHRRDRARLKQQSPTPQDDANPSIILDVVHEYPSRPVLDNSNPAGSTFVLSSSPPSRVSSVLVPISAQENCSTTTTTTTDDSCEDQEKGSLLSLKLSSTITPTTSSSDSSKLEIVREKNSSSKAYDDETAAGGLVLVQNTQEIVKFDSAVSLNLAMLRPYRPTVSADHSSTSSTDDQEVVHIGCKRQRQRTDHVALSLTLSVTSTRDLLDKSDHFQKFSSPMEELDLELRLGNQPN